MTQRPIRSIPFCRNCGTTDVLTDAWASWDAEAGKFVLNTTFDHTHCPECEGETKAIWIEFSEPVLGSDYSYLTVAPCAENDSDSFRTTPEKADFWTIYGVQKDGLTMALHDVVNAKDAALALRGMAETFALPVSYHSEAHKETEVGTLADLADRLAEIIHAEIEGYPVQTDRDFENHLLDALRHPLTQIKEAE